MTVHAWRTGLLENVWRQRSEVDSRGAMASETVRLPSTPLAVAGWLSTQSRRSGGEGAAAAAAQAGMAQCSSSSVAASLNRWWTGPCRCSSPPPAPFREALPRRRRATRNSRISCTSVPRELGTAAEAPELPTVVVDGTEVSHRSQQRSFYMPPVMLRFSMCLFRELFVPRKKLM